MNFLAIVFALLIEQARPLSRSNPMHEGLRAWALSAHRHLDNGSGAQAWLTWGWAVGAPALFVLLVHWALLYSLGWLGWPLALAWNAAVLYVTLGFRQFSYHFTDIRDALEEGDMVLARQRLAEWKRVQASTLPRSELVRHVIEYAVIAAHRHVFGVLAWFSVLALLGLGPSGAVLYRMAEFCSRHWGEGAGAPRRASAALQAVSARAWMLVDWIPARATALCFAVVGSFEEAIEGWRFYAQRFPSDNDGVVLAATAGAIGVRLGGQALAAQQGEGESVFEAGGSLGDSGSTPGIEPQVGHLHSVVGLVWRSVVVWMLLLALLSLARLLG